MITNSGRVMQSIRVVILFLMGVFNVVAQQAHANTDWTLEKDEQNVAIYSRTTPTGYKEIKAVTQLESHPKALMKLLDDTEAGPGWISHCRKVETLDWFGADERTVHTFFSAPWPIQDRDMITYSKTDYDPQTGIITIKVTDKGSEHVRLNHYVRMEAVSGTWTVTPKSEGAIEITYQGYGEASGSIPTWLANRLLVSSTHETFVNMQQQIRLPRYQKDPD